MKTPNGVPPAWMIDAMKREEQARQREEAARPRLYIEPPPPPK